MAKLISCYDKYSLRDAIYSSIDEDVLGVIGERFNDTLSRLSGSFRERVERVSERITSSSLYRKTLGSVRRIKAIGSRDVIKQLLTLEELQNASPIMQNYLMSSRKVRRSYVRRQIDGYNGTYTNPHRCDNPHVDLYHRLLNDGVAVKDDDGVYRAYNYSISKEDSRGFSLQDRGDVRISLSVLEKALDEGLEDPTSTAMALL